jgi:hypothetical protein
MDENNEYYKDGSIAFIDHFDLFRILIIGQRARPLQYYAVLERWYEGGFVFLIFFLTSSQC